MTTKLQTHENAPWLGSFPNGWIFRRGKFFFRGRKEINSDLNCDNVLSLTMNGVIHREELGEGGLLPASYETFQVFYPNNLVFKLIDLENYKTSRVGLVPEKGIMSSAYVRLVPINESIIYPKFAYYFYYNLYLQGIYNFLGMGVRSTLTPWNLLEIPILLPPLQTQNQIAEFLDEKTKIIDELVAKKEKLIELLREKRAALITRAVTKGLNPNANLKASGIDWLGDIPEGWEVKRNRFLGTYQKGKTADICTSDEKDCLPYLSAEVIRGSKEPEFCRGVVVAKEKQILLLWDGANAGEFFWAGPGVVSSTFSLILPQKRIIPIFYYWLLKGFEKLLRDYTQGMGIPHVSPWVLKDSLLPEVPIKEQKQIADFLDAETGRIDEAVMLIKSQIEKLKEYRSSLIYHAVTGKIEI